MDGRSTTEASGSASTWRSKCYPAGTSSRRPSTSPDRSRARKQTIELCLDAANGYRDVPVVHGRLEYSRLTGNCKKRISLSTR